MVRTVLVDDEIDSIHVIKNLLMAHCPEVEIIGEAQELMPGSIFYRGHNSHIINLNWIKNYHKGRGGYILMEDDTSIEVALRRRDDFLKRLLK